MTIADSDIRDVITSFVEIADKSGCLSDVIAHYHDRSLAMKIIGSRFRTGFIINNGKIRMLSDIDKATVTVTLDSSTFWDIMSSESRDTARARIYIGIFTDETIEIDPPPGLNYGTLHITNIIKVFDEIAKVAWT